MWFFMVFFPGYRWRDHARRDAGASTNMALYALQYRRKFL
jgi:hypothetical protein